MKGEVSNMPLKIKIGMITAPVLKRRVLLQNPPQ
jgi:hypothetical protein